MLSKNQIKLIRRLRQKKYRQELGLFTVEGVKSITEFLNSDYQLHSLFSTSSVFDDLQMDYQDITEAELKTISTLTSPNTALAIFKMLPDGAAPSSGLIVALDDLRDPGNLGTIIRLCDWFGIADLVCSPTTVDCYNPKVVQASMGSLSRVTVHYLPLKPYLSSQKIPLYGTYMEGHSVYQTDLTTDGIIVLGNEANGISEPLSAVIQHKLSIPQFGIQQDTESLNVANAAAIFLSEFKRRTIEK